MRLSAAGFVLLVVAIALAILFHKIDRLEDKIEQAHRPKLELIAATVR